MYTNGINSYNSVKDDSSKTKTTAQNFDFDGEAFSDLMGKEKPAGNGLRETAKELAEDESILSTDEENRAMIKKPQPDQSQKQKTVFPEDKARLLRLMDMSNKINLTGANITKSKRELENTAGKVFDDDSEPEDITSVIAKMAANKEKFDICEEPETSIGTGDYSDDYDDNNQDNSQTLYETEEELLEDMSILSTDEENLEMARRNSAMNILSDKDYETTQDDMVFLSEITALNNQMNIEGGILNTQNVINALMSQTKALDNRMDMSELAEEDVDFLIKLLQNGSSDFSNFTDEHNEELNGLSEKFLMLLKDSIINKKVFRIDFDNDISVIIKISTEGKISAEFQTKDEAIETYLKNNLHILKQRFEELNVEYEDVTYKNTSN